MTATCITAAQNRELLDSIGDYLTDAGRSARWLGLRIAGDPRLVPNLQRGQQYPARTLLALSQHLNRFYEGALRAEQAAIHAEAA